VADSENELIPITWCGSDREDRGRGVSTNSPFKQPRDLLLTLSLSDFEIYFYPLGAPAAPIRFHFSEMDFFLAIIVAPTTDGSQAIAARTA
jgi:hypothetical protein